MPSIGKRGAALLPMLLASAGCHRAAPDPATVTPDEQAQLNDAAATLDANRVSANALATQDNGS